MTQFLKIFFCVACAGTTAFAISVMAGVALMSKENIQSSKDPRIKAIVSTASHVGISAFLLMIVCLFLTLN